MKCKANNVKPTNHPWDDWLIAGESNYFKGTLEDITFLRYEPETDISPSIISVSVIQAVKISLEP